MLRQLFEELRNLMSRKRNSAQHDRDQDGHDERHREPLRDPPVDQAPYKWKKDETDESCQRKWDQQIAPTIQPHNYESHDGESGGAIYNRG
jgi:hypothetical protein